MPVEHRSLTPAHTRDPRAATQQVRFVGLGQPQVPEFNAAAATRNGHDASWVVARCVEIIANDVASSPFLVATVPGDPTRHTPGARLARLLSPPPSGPAPKLTARRLWWWTVAQRVVTGRWGWEIEADRGDAPVDYLWPLASSDIKAVPTDGGSEWFARFEVGRPDKPRVLQPDQIVYDWQPSLDDWRDPFSMLQAAALDVSVAVMLGRYSYAFLRNGAVPAVVVVTEEHGDDESRRRFESQWDSRYQGPENAGRTLFHEVGDGEGPVADAIHIERVGISQKDAQMLQQERDALEHVAMALGVPWSRLSASGRTFDNAAQEDRTYWTDTVLPLCTDLQDAVNLQIGERCGPELGWFDLSRVEALAPRPMFTVTDAVAGYAGKLMALNEARAPFGLPPVDGGDVINTDEAEADRELAELERSKLVTEILQKGYLAVQANPPTISPEDLRDLAGLDGPPPPPRAPAAPPTVAGDDQADTDNSDGDGAESSDPTGSGSDTGRGRPPTPAPATNRSMHQPGETGDARRARLWRTTDATVTTLETRWERAWRRLFARQADSVARALTGKRGAKLTARIAEWRADPDPAPLVDPAAVFNPAYWQTESEALAADLYEQVVSAGFARMSDAFGIAIDLGVDDAEALIAARANQLAGQVTDTTYTAIRDVMATGVTEGATLDEIADGIAAVFTDAGTNRATVIARTEVISAYNAASQLGATILGGDVVAAQEWIATRDGRTRPAHAAADGQTIPIGATFDVGGDRLAYPGDPNGSADNTIQCRCTIGFLTPDELDDRAAHPAATRVGLDVARTVLAITAGSGFDPLTVRRALEEAAA